NLGNALQAKGELTEAITCYHRALNAMPDFADAYCNLANTLQLNQEPESAIDSYNLALKINPNLANARSGKFHQQSFICDWDGIAE
ncbi:MAG: tetratricopeptide repeat protein, partial [Pseudomonadales bacterium]